MHKHGNHDCVRSANSFFPFMTTRLHIRRKRDLSSVYFLFDSLFERFRRQGSCHLSSLDIPEVIMIYSTLTGYTAI
jgi:hypothetical protein